METAHCSSPKPDTPPNMTRCWLYEPSIRNVYSVGTIADGRFRHDPTRLRSIADRSKAYRVNNKYMNIEIELLLYKSHHST